MVAKVVEFTRAFAMFNFRYANDKALTKFGERGGEGGVWVLCLIF